MLISLRWRFIASVLTTGMIIAAPTARAGQIAPEYMELNRVDYRAPSAAVRRRDRRPDIFGIEPFCPTLGFILGNQTSIPLPAAEAGKNSHRSGCRSFFKSLLRWGIFLRITRPWLQPCQFQLAQPFSHRSFVYLNAEMLLNFVA